MLTTLLWVAGGILLIFAVGFIISQAQSHARIDELLKKPPAPQSEPSRIGPPATKPPKRRSSKSRDALLNGRLELQGSGRFAVEAVGESHYQSALTAIVAKPGYAQKTCDAVLICENNNRHDANAVRVQISGQTVGYLSRAAALAYREALSQSGYGTVEGVCRARIWGGGDKMRGVWLDL